MQVLISEVNVIQLSIFQWTFFVVVVAKCTRKIGVIRKQMIDLFKIEKLQTEE